MYTSHKLLAAAVIAAAGAVILAGCGATTPENAATGQPIVVAGISSLAAMPEGSEAAKAVFEDFNAAGGLDGRPIQYDVYDDKADPAASTAAAADALESGAVAVVGGSSLLDCAVNGKTWSDNDLIAIQGIGTDPFCFTSPNVAPTNSGAFFGSFAGLTFGSEELGHKNICAVLVYDNALAESVFDQAFTAWEDATGQELAYVDSSLTRGQASYAANVSNLKNQDCDAIFINEVADAVIGFLGEATNQGVDLPVLALTSVYSTQFASSVTSYGGDIYVPAEFVPFTELDNESNADWVAVMDAHGVTKTSFAQGGYLAARLFIDILKGVDAEPTREAITEAARGMTQPIDAPLIEGEWIFGDADAHQPNTKAWEVVLKAGSGEWTSLDTVLDGNELGWVPTVIPAS